MAKKDKKEEMTTEEAIAKRASLHKPKVRVLTELEKKNKFSLFWAKNKKKYKQYKDLEQLLWVHMTSTGQTDPADFENALTHFGLKKVN